MSLLSPVSLNPAPASCTQTHTTIRPRPQSPSPALQPDGCHTDTLLRLDRTDFPIILSLMRSLATQRTIKLSQSGIFSNTPHTAHPQPPDPLLPSSPPPSSQFVYTTCCPITSLFPNSTSASSFALSRCVWLRCNWISSGVRPRADAGLASWC